MRPSDIARLIGVSPRCVRLWIAAGKVRAWRSPLGHLLIDPATINSLLTEMQAARAVASEDPP